MWTRLWRWLLRRTWDDLLQVVGLIGVVWLTVADPTPRPVLTTVFASMLGLPYFVGKDRSRRRRFEFRVRLSDDEDSPPSPDDTPPPRPGSAP